MAYDIAKNSFEAEQKPIMQPNLNALTKFDNSMSPSSLALFSDQLAMSNLTSGGDTMTFLPLMLQGKTAYFIDQLRSAITWGEM